MTSEQATTVTGRAHLPREAVEPTAAELSPGRALTHAWSQVATGRLSDPAVVSDVTLESALGAAQYLVRRFEAEYRRRLRARQDAADPTVPFTAPALLRPGVLAHSTTPKGAPRSFLARLLRAGSPPEPDQGAPRARHRRDDRETP